MRPSSKAVRDNFFSSLQEVYKWAAEIGRPAGVTIVVHPSSHHNTLLFSRSDYRIFALLEPQVGWVPDTDAGGDFGRTTRSEFLKLDCNREESEVAAVDAAAAVRINLGTLRSLRIGT